MHKVRTHYSNCTAKSSEHICSSSGGAPKKGNTGWNSVYQKNRWFCEVQQPSPPPLPYANVFVLQGFKKKTHPMYDQTQGSGAMFYMN
jgi:hypothetical protein